eukprot:477723-Prorocentrum_minimum.AAC.1
MDQIIDGFTTPPRKGAAADEITSPSKVHLTKLKTPAWRQNLVQESPGMFVTPRKDGLFLTTDDDMVVSISPSKEADDTLNILTIVCLIAFTVELGEQSLELREVMSEGPLDLREERSQERRGVTNPRSGVANPQSGGGKSTVRGGEAQSEAANSQSLATLLPSSALLPVANA